MKIFQKFKKLFKQKNIEEETLSESNQEFYSILKMVSGEEIFSLVMVDDNDSNPVVVLQNPIIIKIINNHHGSIVKVKPWITSSDDDIFIVRLDKIITMTEVKDAKLIGIYNSYLNDDDIELNPRNMHTPFSSDGHVKPSSEMGYITSVKEARIILEKIYKDLKES